jgi:hypothetical protein
MHQKTLFLIVAMALVAAPQFALADGDEHSPESWAAQWRAPSSAAL